jgi:hypothetical protein
VPDNQFQFDAERHAELVAVVTVLLGQFIAIEPRFGRQHGPAIALVAGKFRTAIALIAGKSRPAIAFRQLRVVVRQPGLLRAERIPVRRLTCWWRLRLWRFRTAATAATARLAHASVRRRFARQHAVVIRLTDRRWFDRGYARHPGRFDTQRQLNWTRRLKRFGGPTGVHQCGIHWSAGFVWPTGVHQRGTCGTARFGGHRRQAWSDRPTRIHQSGIRRSARIGRLGRPARPGRG